MNRKRKQIIDSNEISKIYNFKLGGYEQKVLIEGKTKDLPVLITLHGGPGTPIPFSVGSRGLFPEFTEQFILVCWDQLGCGINNRKLDEHFTIASFVQMTEDLIHEIKRLFPTNKIYIFATSWGSILSAKTIEKMASKTNQGNTLDKIIDGVVVWGQISKNTFFNQDVYKELKDANLSKKKLEAIKNTDIKNVTNKDLLLVTSSIRKYTNGYQNKNGKKAPMSKIILGLLTSPDYKFKDFKAMVINGFLKNTFLWKEILSTDLTDTLKNISVPYVILQGDTDIVSSTHEIEDIVVHAQNRNLRYRIIPNSGHIPGEEAMNSVLESLLSFI